MENVTPAKFLVHKYNPLGVNIYQTWGFHSQEAAERFIEGRRNEGHFRLEPAGEVRYMIPVPKDSSVTVTVR